MNTAIFGPDATSRLSPSALAALPNTCMTAACMRPGFRTATGWLGLAWCGGAPHAWTCRIAERPGIYGLWPASTEADAEPQTARFQVFYFPAADDPVLDQLGIPAAVAVSAPGAAEAFRDFPSHPDLAAACAIAEIELAVTHPGRSFGLALAAPVCRRIVAPEGVADGNGGWLVPPGGDEESLPAFSLARDVFRVLAAGAAAALGESPNAPRRLLAPAGLRIRHADGGLDDAPGGGSLLTETLRWGADAKALWPEIDHPGNPLPYALCAEVLGGGAHRADRPELIVLSGFLGAGKTSFLNQFIEFHAAHDRLVGVIQNEVGETGVDIHMLEGDHSVLTLDAGCVCCSLAGSLGAALGRLAADLSPQVVVLETTGLANPMNLRAELAEIADLADLRAVVTVVDAARFWETLDATGIAGAQIAAADLVILNKCDRVSEAECAAVATEIRRRNPAAQVIRAIHGRMPPALIPTAVHAPASPCGCDHAHPHGVTHAAEGFASLRLALAAEVDRDRLMACLAAAPPGVMRIKGVVRLSGEHASRIVQFVPGSAAIEDAAKPVSVAPFVLVIGRDLDAGALRRQWSALLEEVLDDVV
jgi:G3E family GTPase